MSNSNGEIERDDKITFGTLSEDGQLSNVRYLTQAQIMACPFAIFVPEHYRDDGTCKCDDPNERARMMNEWEYPADSWDEYDAERSARMNDDAMDAIDDIGDGSIDYTDPGSMNDMRFGSDDG